MKAWDVLHPGILWKDLGFLLVLKKRTYCYTIYSTVLENLRAVKTISSQHSCCTTDGSIKCIYLWLKEESLSAPAGEKVEILLWLCLYSLIVTYLPFLQTMEISNRGGQLHFQALGGNLSSSFCYIFLLWFTLKLKLKHINLYTKTC